MPPRATDKAQVALGRWPSGRHAPRGPPSLSRGQAAHNICLPSRTCALAHPASAQENHACDPCRWAGHFMRMQMSEPDPVSWPNCLGANCPGDQLTDRSGWFHSWIGADERRPTRFHPPMLPSPSADIALLRPARLASAIPMTIYPGPSLSRFTRGLQAKFAGSARYRNYGASAAPRTIVAAQYG